MVVVEWAPVNYQEPSNHRKFKSLSALFVAAMGDINGRENDAEDVRRMCTTSDFQPGWLSTDSIGLSLPQRTAAKCG